VQELFVSKSGTGAGMPTSAMRRAMRAMMAPKRNAAKTSFQRACSMGAPVSSA
jgi:hypothetical protein